MVLVAQEREGQLADTLAGVVPGLVAEVRVGRHCVNFDVHLLEHVVLLAEVFEFGRADEGEVGRVEEEHGPLALHVLFGDFVEIFAGLEGGGGERFDLASDDTHGLSPLLG